MGPHDALLQQDLLRDSMKRGGTHDYMENFFEDVMRKRDARSEHPDRAQAYSILKRAKQAGQHYGRQVAETFGAQFAKAETFYVSQDMCDVATAAAAGLDGLDQFTHDVWPADCGFLLFEGPGYTVRDLWGRDLIVKAIMWSRESFDGHPGMTVSSWSDISDENDALYNTMDDEQRRAFIQRMGTSLSLVTVAGIADGERVGPPTIEIPVEAYQGFEGTDHRGVAVKAQPTAENSTRIILSLLMLLGQTIAKKERVEVARRGSKKSKRMPIPRGVTVIRLRHEREPHERTGQGAVEWAHRWLVRGHWRWARVGPNYPQAVEVTPGEFRARIFIAPFVKGNPEAPFKVTRKINALVR